MKPDFERCGAMNESALLSVLLSFFFEASKGVTFVGKRK